MYVHDLYRIVCIYTLLEDCISAEIKDDHGNNEIVNKCFTIIIMYALIYTF